MFNIVLVEPEIPQNTGNIVRTAAATGCKVHLVKPLGFDISDKALKRAGLDYWHLTDFTVYENLDDFFSKTLPECKNYWYASTKACHRYDAADYQAGDYLVFGKETKGLPEELLHANYENTIRIPMIAEARSLNLSNSVAVVVYEALRHHSYAGLKGTGKLTQY